MWDRTQRDGMTEDGRTADVERFLAYLHDRLGDSLRSCVEYTPQTSTMHYVRAQIDERAAQSRLVRLSELYHSERLSADPLPDDPEFGPLHASVHVFGESTVVHLIERSGVVYGFSVDHHAIGDLFAFVRDAAEALYGEVPAGLELNDVEPDS